MSLCVNPDTQAENLLGSVRHMDRLLQNNVHSLVLRKWSKYVGEDAQNRPCCYGVVATILEEAVQISTLVTTWFAQFNERLIGRQMVADGRLRVLF